MRTRLGEQFLRALAKLDLSLVFRWESGNYVAKHTRPHSRAVGRVWAPRPSRVRLSAAGSCVVCGVSAESDVSALTSHLSRVSSVVLSPGIVLYVLSVSKFNSYSKSQLRM